MIDHGAAAVGFYQTVGANGELQCRNDFATNVRGAIFLTGGKRLIVAGQGAVNQYLRISAVFNLRNQREIFSRRSRRSWSRLLQM
jgi:hypothetical protein